jgi:hypothetical protein
VLDPAVALEVEDRLLTENGGVEIAIGHDQLVTSVLASATISPSGLMMVLPAIIG